MPWRPVIHADVKPLETREEGSAAVWVGATRLLMVAKERRIERLRREGDGGSGHVEEADSGKSASNDSGCQ